MDTKKLTPHQYQIRSCVRAFLMVATREQLQKELELSLEKGDTFRAECVQELIDELDDQ